MKKIFINFYLAYLRFFAQIQLKKISPLIIGIGGASGKSSTALLLGNVLKNKYKVKEGKGKNSETGLPLSILDIEMKDYSISSWIKALFAAPFKTITNHKKYDIYIAEMGIDSPKPPKNMDYLLRILKPNIGVLTNIDIEHSLNFDEFVKEEDIAKRRDEILAITAKEEGLLLKSLDSNSTSVINLDDENISGLLPLKSRTITISLKDKNADFYVNQVKISKDNFEMGFIFLKEKYKLEIKSPLPKYYAYSFIYVIAISFLCKINIEEVITLIEQNFSLPPGRFSIFNGIKNSTIIDSSYNSSLAATTGAIESLSLMAKGRRVGILGDMRELGTLSRYAHETLAKVILKNLDFAIIIGPMMREYVAPILERENFKFISFEKYKDAKDEIISDLRNNDFILVKSSQNTLFLERVVEMLLANKKDVEKLPRRGSFWNSKRRLSG